MKLRSWYFIATILRDDGQEVTREGSVHAQFPLGALDQIKSIAEKTWQRPLLQAEVYDVDSDGCLDRVATSNYGRNHRTNSEIATHTIEPGWYDKTPEEEKPAVTYSDTPTQPPPTQSTFFPAQFGVSYSRRVYATMKLPERR
jgi:hypothetical protein